MPGRLDVWLSDNLIAAQERHWKEVGKRIRRKNTHQRVKGLQDLPDVKGKIGLTLGEIRNLRNGKAMRAWRNRVMRNGNHVCKWCEATGPTLHADHKIPLSVLLGRHKIKTLQQALSLPVLFDSKNGQVLCSNCHRKKTRKDAARNHWSKDWIDRLEQEWEVEIREFSPKIPAKKRRRPSRRKQKKKRRQRGHQKLFARCEAYCAERDREIHETITGTTVMD